MCGRERRVPVPARQNMEATRSRRAPGRPGPCWLCDPSHGQGRVVPRQPWSQRSRPCPCTRPWRPRTHAALPAVLVRAGYERPRVDKPAGPSRGGRARATLPATLGRAFGHKVYASCVLLRMPCSWAVLHPPAWIPRPTPDVEGSPRWPAPTLGRGGLATPLAVQAARPGHTPCHTVLRLRPLWSVPPACSHA